MNYYLGFDGGGTKTECVVLDEFGRTVGQAAAGPSNPLRVGLDQATLALANAAVEALAGMDPGLCCIRAVCAGLAGAGRPSVVKGVAAFLAQSFPGSLVHVTTDLEVALEAAVGSGPGVVLVAGTGSSAYGRDAKGGVARAGGHGPWIGDKGSAFDIGRRALVAVASAHDLGAPPPRLVEMVVAALDTPGWEELVECVAHNPDDIFPQLFPVVVEAAEAGDNTARGILSAAASELADLAATVIRRLGLRKAEFGLAKSGGVFGRSALLDRPLDDALRRFAPRARISQLRVSPAVGAAQLARRLADSRPSGEAHGAEG